MCVADEIAEDRRRGFHVTPGGLAVREMVEGLAFEELVRLTGVPLKAPSEHALA